MKHLIFITLILISCNLYGQLLIRTPYEVRMDSIGASNCYLGSDIMRNSVLVGITPHKWSKVVIKANFNRGLIEDNYSLIVNNAEYNEGKDYLSFGKYDIRLRVYITKRFSFINRVLVSEINRSVYQYTSGVRFNF